MLHITFIWSRGFASASVEPEDVYRDASVLASAADTDRCQFANRRRVRPNSRGLMIWDQVVPHGNHPFRRCINIMDAAYLDAPHLPAALSVVAQLVNPDLLEEAKPVELDIGRIIFGSQTPLNHADLCAAERLRAQWHILF